MPRDEPNRLIRVSIVIHLGRPVPSVVPFASPPTDPIYNLCLVQIREEGKTYRYINIYIFFPSYKRSAERSSRPMQPPNVDLITIYSSGRLVFNG